MRIEKSLIRKVLKKPYEGCFPHPCHVAELCDALGMEKEGQSILVACRYLEVIRHHFRLN